jgi:pyrroloquinoline quinone (PQQ) biosynthesis protein C
MALEESLMTMHLTANPAWVAEMDAALEPLRQAILDTPVVEDASENELDEASTQNFVVAFYPIIRDFPQWLGVLLKRSPAEGRAFFEDNIRVERRHDAMWRAMGDGFGVPKDRFRSTGPMLPSVQTFHGYLTGQCSDAPFAVAVAATNYAVEGVAQQISEKALRGLAANERIGPRGRWWLEEHAKYDDEHPIHALEIIKTCVARGEKPADVVRAAQRSLELMERAMRDCYA